MFPSERLTMLHISSLSNLVGKKKRNFWHHSWWTDRLWESHCNWSWIQMSPIDTPERASLRLPVAPRVNSISSLFPFTLLFKPCVLATGHCSCTIINIEHIHTKEYFKYTLTVQSRRIKWNLCIYHPVYQVEYYCTLEAASVLSASRSCLLPSSPEAVTSWIFVFIIPVLFFMV